MIAIPKVVLAWAEKHDMSFQVETWFQDGQAYQDWHYGGPHHNVVEKYEHYPDQALELKEYQDSSGNRIRLEVWIVQKTPDETSTDPWCRGQRVYRKHVRQIYEWRNNGGFKGIYMSELDLGDVANHRLTLEEKDVLFSDKYEDLTIKQAKELTKKVEDRFCYCIDTMCKIFGVKFDYYYFPDAEEGQMGTFDRDCYRDEISYCATPIHAKAVTDDWDYNQGIPTAWLWTDFEDDLKEEIKQDKIKKEDKAIKAKEKKENRTAAIASIRKKLTKEELKFVTFK